MGAFSTVYITRGRAKLKWHEIGNTITDEMLKDFLDKLLEERLYNVRIVDDDEDNDDDLLDE